DAVALNQSNELADMLGPFDTMHLNINHLMDEINNKIGILSSISLAKDSIEETVNLSTIPCAEINTSNELINYLMVLYKGITQVRNAQVTLMAPTGTISFMMDCETTGIEPILSFVTYKSLVGGGSLKLTIPSFTNVVKELGYDIHEIPADLDKWINTLKENEKKLFATSLSNTNPISPESHIDMMSEMQPFLSGAISKTVNMPNNSTVEDVYETYFNAWESKLKSIAIYRNGCKDSQPLNLTQKEDVIIQQPARLRLPDTRDGVIHKFTIAGHDGYLIIGEFDDGKPGELFIEVSKEGSTISGLTDSIAIMISLLLQHRVDLSIIVNKLKFTKFDPAGITNNPDIRFATSIMDYIAKFLELRYLAIDNIQVKKEDIISINPSIEDHVDLCDNCGSLLVQAGSCKSCKVCGLTTGCS
ncbi:MAG: hypothetical protein HGB12_12630, partial [Bacteroidetes bacterium]|nr:hypothetical protein [Bacteroidota bacterium]